MRELVDRADWETLEEEWLEVISQEELPYDELMETGTFIARKDRKRAVFLLNLLIEELVDRKKPEEAEPILRMALDLAPANKELKDHLESVLAIQHGDKPYFNRFMEYAGLRDEKDPRKAWEGFRSLLRIVPGTYVYHYGWSAGKITDIDIISEEISVDFIKKPLHVMSWSMALQSLEWLPADHIHAYMVDRRNDLLSMEPVSLLGLAIRSSGGEMDQKQIRALVEPVIQPGGWTSWWSKARSQIESEPRIRPSLSRPIKYRWAEDAAVGEDAEKRREIMAMDLQDLLRVASRVRSREELKTLVFTQVRKRLKRRHVDPLLRFEALLTLAVSGETDVDSEIQAIITSVDDPVSLVMGLKSQERKKYALAEWDAMDGEDRRTRNVKLFLAADSSKDRQLVTDRMSNEEKERLIWTVLRQLPDQGSAFFWLVERAEKGFPLPYSKLDRLVTLLGLLGELPGLKTPVTSFIEGSSLFAETLREIDIDGASRLKEVLDETDISVSQKKELSDAIVDAFPDLKEEGDHILTTSEGLQNREKELRQLVKVELPENKRAIGEAMAHGDLRENFEYKAAKEQQERILARISELEREISRVKLIQPESVDSDSVNPGVVVTVTDVDGESSELTILGPWDSDPARLIFSYRAPGIRPLMGKKLHERVELNVDRWNGEYTITRIRVWRLS